MICEGKKGIKLTLTLTLTPTLTLTLGFHEGKKGFMPASYAVDYFGMVRLGQGQGQGQDHG